MGMTLLSRIPFTIRSATASAARAFAVETRAGSPDKRMRRCLRERSSGAQGTPTRYGAVFSGKITAASSVCPPHVDVYIALIGRSW